MYKIFLINMPFAALNVPSLALTQLKAVVEERFKERVSVEVLYLNYDYARHLDPNLYHHIANSLGSHFSGLGDWFFRHSAFPELPDNTEDYFKRYYPYQTGPMNEVKKNIVDKRSTLDGLANNLIATHRLAEADIIGFTSMFTQNLACFALARKIKESNPKIITIMGGANCETPMGQEIVKNVKSIDFVFSGPGLKSFSEFIECCLAGEVEKCHQIKGVFSKNNYPFLQLNPIGEELPLDTLISLDYESFLDTLAKYFPNGEIEPTLLFETSRGCWWGERAHCTFCGLNGVSMAYRSMSPEKALKQFDDLFKYSSRVSHFESVDNILPKPYFEEVFPKLSPPSHIDLFYEVKADLSEKDLETLSRANVRTVQPGVESLATSTLKLMKKGTTVFQNLSLLKNCLIHNVWPVWNLLVGFPGEEEDVYKKYVEDIPSLIHLPPPVGVFPVRFDRYSPYFVQAKTYELDLKPLDYYQLTYPFSRESLANVAYYFADANIGARYSINMIRWIDNIRAQVHPWLARWRSEDCNQQPKLYFKQKGSSTVVIDTRSTQAVEYEISDISRQTLEQLNRVSRVTDLNSRLGHILNFDAAREIASLQDLRLIFQEGDRYMSLVLPGELRPLIPKK